MRIAATFDSTNGEIFQHFGKTQQFRIYDTDGGTITHAQTIGTDGNGHGQRNQNSRKSYVQTYRGG